MSGYQKEDAMTKQLTIREFFNQYPDDNVCLDHIMAVRYGMRHQCQKCGMKATFHKVTDRRAYACSQCGDHLYPCTGTLFEDSRTPLQLWFYALYLFSSTRHGVSAKELQRQLGVTYKCAWRMGHEIRKHMADVDGEDPLSGGIVEVDETYVGGKEKGKVGRPSKTDKAVLIGMLQRGGDLITKVVPDVRKNTLQPVIKANVKNDAELYTDELLSYKSLWLAGYKHQTIAHGRGEFVRGDVHTNSIESYWAQLKKGISSTHIHVSKKHMEKYAKEFEYRFNSRKNPDQMFPELISSFPKSST